MIHEDERRILEDWPCAEMKTIRAKKLCSVGNHYHKIKTERFILSQGWAELTIEGILIPMKIGVIHEIRPGERHSFELSADAILIGLCSHPYDPTDDYK